MLDLSKAARAVFNDAATPEAILTAEMPRVTGSNTYDTDVAEAETAQILRGYTDAEMIMRRDWFRSDETLSKEFMAENGLPLYGYATVLRRELNRRGL